MKSTSHSAMAVRGSASVPLAVALVKSEPIIELSNVTKSYAGASTPALHPMTLSVQPGEFFSILGPSGSGKTTTLRLIAGFETPDSGSVVLGGVEVTHLPPENRDVNTVFQNYALFPHLTIEQNVAYPLQMKKVKEADIRSRVNQALELVEMSGFENRLPHQLSGGQRQRIALARALVGNPKVLLLDEPLGALDLRLRQQMQHVLTTIQERLGITFVYVTHDQSEALSMSDRVAIMNNGRIEQIGTPEDLYYAPKNTFVAGFVGKSNLLDAQIIASDNLSLAKFAGHTVELPQSAQPGKVKLALRCESVTISRTPVRDGRVCIPARVSNVLFLGNCLEVCLQADDIELLASIPAQRQRTLTTDDAVFCSFDPADLVVLHE
jgi:spermidine/putrescine transport system ATP-binding protein